jgi:NAD-dependent dihydropyrimidine dehydrogenase PreA subunit
MLVEVYGIRVPDLAIMDGIVGMHGNGPTNKSLYPVGKLMASDDGVALDTVMCHMMGMKPEKVLMVKLAGEKGLGECDLSRIDVIGDASRLKRFRQPVPSLPQLFGGSFIGAFFPNIGRPRFDVDTSACNECRTCEKSCPAAAVKIEGGSPRYEYSQCIACFCCMELCPKQAIGLQDSLATRIYRLVGQLQNSEMKHFK